MIFSWSSGAGTKTSCLVMNEQALIPLAWMSVACAKLLGFSGKGKMRGHYPTQTQTQPHHRLPIGSGLVRRPWQ